MSLPLSIKRINRDIQLCRTTYAEEFEKQGIYLHFDEDDIKYCYVMIYGPEKKYDYFAEKEIDTPYYGGFYLFKMKFPNDYPISPPFMGFRTSFSDWRCHPNFYERSAGSSKENLGGKVCLSMINTFGNQDWTPSRRISEILIQLQEDLIQFQLDMNLDMKELKILKKKILILIQLLNMEIINMQCYLY